jgi:hypothetical protein
MKTPPILSRFLPGVALMDRRLQCWPIDAAEFKRIPVAKPGFLRKADGITAETARSRPLQLVVPGP